MGAVNEADMDVVQVFNPGCSRIGRYILSTLVHGLQHSPVPIQFYVKVSGLGTRLFATPRSESEYGLGEWHHWPRVRSAYGCCFS